MKSMTKMISLVRTMCVTAIVSLLAQSVWAATGDVISINFYQGDNQKISGNQTTDAGDIPQSNWNDLAARRSGGTTTTDNLSAYNPTTQASASTTVSCSQYFSEANIRQNPNLITDTSYSYLKASLTPQLGSYNGTAKVDITGIPYAKYDVVLYFFVSASNNNANDTGKQTPFHVSTTGTADADYTQYTVGEDGTPTTGSTNWGRGSDREYVLGQNTAKFTNLTASEFHFKHASANCGLCAIQIVDRTPTEEPTDTITPVLLLNLGTSENVAGWTNKTQSDGAKLPKEGKFTDASGVGFLAAVASGDGGNFSANNECNTDFDTGTYVDILGETHSTITSEVKASLGLPESTTFDSKVYKTGLLNGGYSGHTGTISGLTPGQPYVVYLGFGRKGNDVTYFKMEASGFGKAESIAYVSTVARSGSNATAKASEYTEYSVGSQIGTGSVEGLMIVRMANITPNSDGNIVFYMPGGRAGMNFIAVAKSTLVAKVDGKAYTSFTEALSKAIEIGNAQAPAVVALMADVADNFEVPANVTVDANGFALTGTITGAGRVVFNTMPSAAQQTNFKDSTKWTGTVELRDYEDASDANKICNFNLLGNAQSTVCLNGVKSTMYTTDNSTGNYPMITLGTLEIGPKGWSSISGLNYSNSPRYNVNLTGTGTITVLTGNPGTVNFIGDHSGFKGSINASNGSKGVILSPAGASKVADTNTGAQIIIGEGQTIEIAEGQTFTATSGIKIRGNIKGSGTLNGPVTFENTSGIDPSSGTLQLASGRVCYFGSTINIIGEQETGTSLLTGVGSEPTGLAYVSVSVNGTTKVGAVLTYEDRTIKYSYQESAYWTPNSECVDANRIFDWSAENAWKDKNNQDATWSVGAGDEDKPDVVIDASVIKGVKITGQVYVGNITVVGTLADVESFQFHNHLQVVDNDHEVNPDGEGHDCLHTTSISLTGLSGTVGMKVPITGEIAFGSTTRLVFVTGTDDAPSSAYGYTFVDRGGAIIVEGAGKFVVPSSMYGTPFAPASGAKLVYRAAGTVSGTVSGAGSVIKDGDTTVTFTGTNTFTGGTIVEAGTLKLGSPRCLGAQGAAVTVKPNGILDVGGVQNHGIVLTLAGGTLKNSVGNVSTSNVQFRSISLSADSVIDIDYSTGIVNNGHNETTLQLNTHKLIKKGEGTFLITHVNVSNGTIEIQAGEIKVEQGYNCNFTDVAFTVPSTSAQDIVVQNGTSTSAGNGTVFKAAERTGGETIYIKTASGTYQLASGNAATLKTGDIIVFENSIYATGGDRWGSAPSFSAKFAGHKVIVNISMNIRGGLSANQEVEVNDTCYLYGGMADGASVAGTGTLYVGYDTSTFGNVSISCTKFGLQNNGSTYTAFISGAVDASQVTTIELGGNDDHFKLTTEDASLKVPSRLTTEGKVISGVDGKTVYFNEEHKTYGFVEYETLQAWSFGTIIFDGDLHKLTENNDGTYTKIIDGVTYTINLNGHELVTEGDKSYILIKEQANGLGVTVTREATNGTGLTMIVKYSDFGYSENDTKTIPLTISSSNYDNVVAPYIALENGTMKAAWANFINNSAYDSSSTDKFDSSIETGYLALSYGTSGTRVFQKEEGVWSEVYKNADVKGSGTYDIKGVSVGGVYSKKSGVTTAVADGMKVHALAITTTPIYATDATALTGFALNGDDLVYNSFLTQTAVDTGWIVNSLDDLLDYTFYGTMDGSSIAGNNVDARGFHLKKVDNTVTFQMQVHQYQDDNDKYLKAVEVVMSLDSNNHVQIKASGTANNNSQLLGYEFTSLTDTPADSASAGGYGVNKVVATKKPVPFASVGYDGDTWTSSAVMDDHASGRVTGNFMNEKGTNAAGNFVAVRGSTTDKAVKISADVRPSYKRDPIVTFGKAVTNDANWTVQIVAKMVPQTNKRLALWGIGQTSYQGNANDSRGVALLLGADGLPKFVGYGCRTTRDIATVTSGDSLYDNRYHVYTVVCDKNAESDKYIVYVDGVRVAGSGATALAAIPTTDQYFEVGTVRGGANELHNSNSTPTAIAVGSFIDDVAAWNVALTADEVKANAKKFPVWPLYVDSQWQGGDNADIAEAANWGAEDELDLTKMNGVFPANEANKTVTISGEVTIGSIEINGTYTFSGNGSVNVSLLSFGDNGSLILKNGAKLVFNGALEDAMLAKITFAGGTFGFTNVPSLGSKTIKVDGAALQPGAYTLLEWTEFMADSFGYGNPTIHMTSACAYEYELIPLVDKIALKVYAAGEKERAPLRIWCVGDSITEGYNGGASCANYRVQLAEKLTLDGYNVRMVGMINHRSFLPSGEFAPDKWMWHSGVSAQRVWTQRNNGASNNRAAYMEAIDAAMFQVGEADVVLIKLGTNDIGNGDSADHILEGITNIVGRVMTGMPNAKVALATTIWYKNNNVTTLSEKIRDWVATDPYPNRLVVADVNEAIPARYDSEGRDLYYSDQVHPNWNGHNKMSTVWADAVKALYPKATDAHPKSAQKEVQRGAVNNVDEAYRANFKPYKSLAIPEKVSYTMDGTTRVPKYQTQNEFSSATKVGYYLELVRPATDFRNEELKYVWVDMDIPAGKTLDDMLVPTKATLQQVVSHIHVDSNMGSVTKVEADDDSVSGLLEFSPFDATPGATTAVAGMPAAIWGCMDWNDTLPTSGSAGRGVMQIHRIHTKGTTSWNTAEVLFAWNNWGEANDPTQFENEKNQAVGEIGIGNFSQHFMASTETPGQSDVRRRGMGSQANAALGISYFDILNTTKAQTTISLDYSCMRFSPWCDRMNAAAYEVRNLEIWVKGTPVEITEEDVEATETEITVTKPAGADSIVITSDDVEVEEGATSIPLTTGLYKVAAIKDGVEVATEQIGVVAAKTEATTDKTTTAVAVPFTGATVANLLNTALLAEDDMLMAYLNGSYKSWKLTAEKTWTPAATLKVGEGEVDVPAAEDAVLKRGTAVWVTTAGKVVVLGKYNEETEILKPTTEETHLLANPTMKDYTPTVKSTDAEDQVMMVGEATPTRFTKKNGAWTKSAVKKYINGNPVYGDVTEAPVIPVGKGFWFIKK